MTMWVVRHAKPRVAPGICYGALDIPAEPEATQLAARRLAEALPHGALVHTSVLQRCELLAQCLQGLRSDLSFKREPRLVEMHFGHHEGVPWSEIDKQLLDAWTADFWKHRFGGQESLEEFMARVAEVWDACQPARASGQVQVWITHAGVARAVTLLAQGVRHVDSAELWPKEAPGFGEWMRVLP